MNLIPQSSVLVTHHCLLVSRHHDNFHLGAILRRAVSIRRTSPIRREDNLYLVELTTSGASDPQLSRGYRKFDFDRLTTGKIATGYSFLESVHLIPRLFPARPL